MRNKTNVKYVKIKYFKGENQTICTLTYEIDVNRWPIMGFKINADILNKVAEQLDSVYCKVDKKTNYPTSFGFSVIGTATCDVEKDEFNEKTGNNISLTRAQAKAFEKTCKFYDLLQMEIDKSFSEMTRAIDNNWTAANKCWDHAKELGNY